MIEQHIAAFNAAVRSGEWDVFAERFATDGTFEVVGVLSVSGRDAITAAYRANPPDDTMSVLSVQTDGSTDVARVRWDRGGTATMRLTWTEDGAIASLVVTFDDGDAA